MARTRKIEIRVSDEEHEALKTMAKAVGQSLSEFVRTQLVSGVPVKVDPEVRAEDIPLGPKTHKIEVKADPSYVESLPDDEKLRLRINFLKYHEGKTSRQAELQAKKELGL